MFSRLLLLAAFGFVAMTIAVCSLAFGSSSFVVCIAIASTAVVVACFPVIVASRFALDDETLADDLRRLATIVDLDAFAAESRDDAAVGNYYAATTFRDYRFLARFVGSDAMHTRLESTTSSYFPVECPRQVLHALTHVTPPSRSREEPRKVLEIGFGKGVNTAFLAATTAGSSGVRFFGLDLVPEHVEHARRVVEDRRVSLFLGDATNPPSELRENGPYDLVFGIESMCYLDTEKKMDDFFAFAETHVKPGGRIVVVDGFRPDDFDEPDAHYSSNARRAMELAESGYRLRRMASMEDWKTVSSRHGFVVVDEIDLTAEALPFWTKGWRVGRALLVFALPLVSWYRASAHRRTETFANLVSVCTTAHAMRSGTARYGVLAFEKEA